MSELLTVKNLTVGFRVEGETLTRTDRVNLEIQEGEIVCIVGESGCGKSVTSLALMGLLPENGRILEGSVCFEGQELTTMSEKELDRVRGNRMAMIFQDPLTSLNPVFTVGFQIAESLRVHRGLKRAEAKQRAISLLGEVGMPEPEAVYGRFPHMLSGGMRQRAMIAMALACDPKLLIADEPTTALDVTVQAQIMALLVKLCRERGMALLLITHDMGLVSQVADRVLVMYAGQVVEQAAARALFAQPLHPYTRALLACVPSVSDAPDRVLEAIPGMVPEHYEGLQGCRFADRCSLASEACRQEVGMRTAKTASASVAGVGVSDDSSTQRGDAHVVRCVFSDEVKGN